MHGGDVLCLQRMVEMRQNLGRMKKGKMQEAPLCYSPMRKTSKPFTFTSSVASWKSRR
jgi:hypothetical protein